MRPSTTHLSMTPVPITLDRSAPDPLPAQLADQVRHLILAGTLARETRLPSSRALARDLGVSRTVTEQAYEQLVAEGWLAARHGAGTFVAPDTAHVAAPGARARPAPAGEQTLIQLDTGTPWIDPRHQAGWRRAWREVSATTPPPGYPDPRGLPELRFALADRLARTRGLEVHPDEIVITAGTTDGLRQLLAELRPGPVGIEDPGYRAAVETVRVAGRDVVDLPATDVPATLTGLVGAYVTPAHQHPLGRVMPAADRLALLAAAHAADAIVIEDDYDSEFRYDVAPVPALASLDRDRVAYLGTASKSASPGLRLGWMVPPPALLDAVVARRTLTHDSASWASQRALVTLLRDGWLDKVVRTARRVYAERAPRVAAAMSPYATLAGPLAGMYSTWLLPDPDARHAMAAAAEAGFEPRPLTAYTRTSPLTGLVIGFGGVTDDQLERALAALTRPLVPRAPDET